MKKSRFWFKFLLMSLMTTPVFALPALPAFIQNRAIEISISGIGPAVDTAAYETVRQVIGHAVADGTIDKFVVYGYGIEGGFSACVEAPAHAQAGSLDGVMRRLHTISPNPQTTAYSVTPAESCTVDTVACTQDAKLCADGSSVGRVPPSCSFAPCPAKE
ncbi:MAG: hypothetical protein ACXV9T_11040 [Methylobacter sp.]